MCIVFQWSGNLSKAMSDIFGVEKTERCMSCLYLTRCNWPPVLSEMFVLSIGLSHFEKF